jgi:type I restriction enzyme M protein
VQSEKFIEAHGGNADDISIYGQEANPTTWRLVAMNLAIRGFAVDLGKEPADTFHRNQHPDLRFDYILANPPFNISDWGGERLVNDKRWVYGTPPAGNANYAWLQHILHHLSPRGQAGVVLANGSMSSNTNNEGVIRKAMVEADVVDVMVALPTQLFFNTPIPACLWFLAKDKSGAAVPGGKKGRDRRGEVLFIDARKLGRMETRVNRVFDDEDVARVASTVHRWRGDGEDGADEPYTDVPGFCRAVKLSEIGEHGHVLTPGRYVGAEEADDDDEAFNEKMERLTAQLAEQMAKGAELDAVIREKLGGMGYGV